MIEAFSGLAFALIAIAAAFFFGGKKQRDKDKIRDRKAHDQVKEDAKTADVSDGDAAADAEWLRNRGKPSSRD